MPEDTRTTEGDNHRLVMAEGLIRGAIWKRPDLDSAQGAANARQIELTLVEWLRYKPLGLLLDVSEGPEVAGPKTEETIGAWFEAYARANVPIAVQVGTSAMQKMQYQRLLQAKAGAKGKLCTSQPEALAFLTRPA
jgi:hypothetical protein